MRMKIKTEIAEDMAKILAKEEPNKIIMALDCLSRASDLLDVSENHAAVEAITRVAEEIALHLKK
jgi:predicted metal-dependent TIM-barrel fold hydrolase